MNEQEKKAISKDTERAAKLYNILEDATNEANQAERSAVRLMWELLDRFERGSAFTLLRMQPEKLEEVRRAVRVYSLLEQARADARARQRSNRLLMDKIFEIYGKRAMFQMLRPLNRRIDTLAATCRKDAEEAKIAAESAYNQLRANFGRTQEEHQAAQSDLEDKQ